MPESLHFLLTDLSEIENPFVSVKISARTLSHIDADQSVPVYRLGIRQECRLSDETLSQLLIADVLFHAESECAGS